MKRQKNVGCGKAHFTSNWKCCLRLNLISFLHPSWIANFMSQQIMRVHFTSKQSSHFVKTDFDKLPNEDSKDLTWNRAYPVPSVRDIPRTIPGAAKRRGRAAKQRGLRDSVKWVSRSPPVTFYRTFEPNLWQRLSFMISPRFFLIFPSFSRFLAFFRCQGWHSAPLATPVARPLQRLKFMLLMYAIDLLSN